MLCAFLGVVIETIFLWIVEGRIMSRSSVLYGPFSVVWGLGGVFMTLLMHPLRKRGNLLIFAAGTLLGGVYEYMCSVFTEKVWGAVYWDYSTLPLNINGRVTLVYCFCWGIAAVVWMRLIYPHVSRLIQRIPPFSSKFFTGAALTLMAINMVISSLAVARYVERRQGLAPDTEFEIFMDNIYPDELMQTVYPHMWLR